MEVMKLPANGCPEKIAFFILKNIWNFMGEIGSFLNLKPPGTQVILKSVPGK
jgi:hypothetical protein